MAYELSERIAALRKERGLTQEQLGTMVGVSAQAVSKWEKGGTPDVELLPVLSRQLGVTIDALFGMEGGEREDPAEAVGRWLRGFPAKERLNQFCHLVWRTKQYFLSEADGEIVLPKTDYPETCKLAYGDGGELLMLSQIVTQGGIFFDVHAEDLSFVTLWPRPKGGWAPWLAPKEDCRALFSVLSRTAGVCLQSENRVVLVQRRDEAPGPAPRGCGIAPGIAGGGGAAVLHGVGAGGRRNPRL